MTNIKKSFTSRIPERSIKSAKFAAIGAGFGSLIGRKYAMIFGSLGAYVGSRIGERTERKQLEKVYEVSDSNETEDVETVIDSVQ